MGAYFKPWRRKIGVVTLVMACVFMGGWLRSLWICDSVFFVKDGNLYSLNSANGKIDWKIDFVEKPDVTVTWMRRPLEPYLRTTEEFSKLEAAKKAKLQKLQKELLAKPERLNTEMGQRIAADLDTRIKRLQQRWVASYWSIVIPLTLISLWLLLSKPRKSTPKKTAEPIATEGT